MKKFFFDVVLFKTYFFAFYTPLKGYLLNHGSETKNPFLTNVLIYICKKGDNRQFHHTNILREIITFAEHYSDLIVILDFFKAF